MRASAFWRPSRLCLCVVVFFRPDPVIKHLVIWSASQSRDNDSVFATGSAVTARPLDCHQQDAVLSFPRLTQQQLLVAYTISCYLQS